MFSHTEVRSTIEKFVKDQKARERLVAAVEAGLAARLRTQKRRSRKLRYVGLILGGAVIVVGVVPPVRNRLKRLLTADVGRFARSGSATIEQEIEVAVPVTTAYNQWTQFEEFPRFMEGVDEVKQLDDTLLHWAATVGGKKAEWEAKIVEQEPDNRIVWESIAGRNTRGIVRFEEAGPAQTRIHLSMTYKLDGAAEKAGAAAGLDDRRVRGDLERFRELMESGPKAGSKAKKI